MKILCLSFVVLIAAAAIECAERSLPPYIDLCNINDPNLNQCIVDSANKAIPQLKNGDKKHRLISLDPLKINEIILNPGNNWRMKLTNTELLGLGDLKVISADAHIDDGFIIFKMFLPRSVTLGDYDTDGKVLFVPIKGTGKANITSLNLEITSQFKFKIVEKNGINQVVPNNGSIDYTVSQSIYHLTNLFNGDKRLADELNKFLNENSVEVEKEFHHDYTGLLAQVIDSILASIFENVPYEKIFLQ